MVCGNRPAGGGSAFMMPGRKNEAGDAVPLALMPEHPAASRPNPVTKAGQSSFLMRKLTWLL